ncbi:uncharacterized protein LOC109858755 [Pseudomyrmex gracilis]|uniref:uncharacterized protein LOC109858755 n=1 Tax=Pseudomyrmex gracilis TaxID=219809 RepID=UPI000995A779|nr:uncharacterized protein LOC109858755 [Pseudomyrmex gracilis]XP_020291910.1 uncharacterized protein LOC109858755 [Pseudomyrmex gracilis]
MSFDRYGTMDRQQDRLRTDFKYPHNCYTTACCKGDPPFPDSSIQMGKIAHTYETTERRESSPPAVPVGRMQIRLKLLEDTNAILYLRNQDLTARNKSLEKRLEDTAIKIEKLEENVSTLQNELSNEKRKLARTNQTRMDKVCVEKCTSSSNIVSKIDRESQIWEACEDCHGKLDSCQKELSAVTITRSEFELLEKDIRTLRDAVIAREEDWDKAMNRERNCRQQLARLTAEAITARHLCETRQDELCTVNEALTQKESELKIMQKETLYLNKLISQLYWRQKELEECASGNVRFNINEKDQRYIEEIARRVKSFKKNSKTKSKCTSDRYSNSNSPRESKDGRDLAGSSGDHRN